MSALLLVGAAALWVLAHRKLSQPLIRAAALVHGLGMLATLFMRNDLPPAGWASVAVVMSWLPVAPALFRPDHPVFRPLCIPSAFLALLAACWSLAIQGPGVSAWTGWSTVHIVCAVLAMGAALGASILALHRLRGFTVSLLAAAIVITALPLAGPRASTVFLYQDSAPAFVDAHIVPGTGDVGVTRRLQARAPLPGEAPLRQAAVLSLLVLMAAALIRRFSQRDAVNGIWSRIALIVLGAHALLLGSSMLPRVLLSSSDPVAETTQSILDLELSGGERVLEITIAAAPLTGGPGAPSNTLPLALIAFGLVLAAVVPATSRGKYLDLEDRVVRLATALLACTIATGMGWSNFSWGGPVVADPKLFASLAALGAYGLYFLARSHSSVRAVSAVLGLLAFAILLFSMLGPELGWTAPSLHYFGA